MLWDSGSYGLLRETPVSLLHYASDMDDNGGILLGYNDMENALPLDAACHSWIYGDGDYNLYCMQLEKIQVSVISIL